MGFTDYSRAGRDRILRGDLPDWVKNSPRSRYIAAIIVSTPPWVTRKELKVLKDKAAAMTKETGMLHVLDHKIPIHHSRVCGLTVPWNLEVVPWRYNSAKSNHWQPDQMELFD